MNYVPRSSFHFSLCISLLSLATYFLRFPLISHYSHVLLVSLVILTLKRLLEKMNSTEILLRQAQQTAKHLINKTMSYLGRNVFSFKAVSYTHLTLPTKLEV